LTEPVDDIDTDEVVDDISIAMVEEAAAMSIVDISILLSILIVFQQFKQSRYTNRCESHLGTRAPCFNLDYVSPCIISLSLTILAIFQNLLSGQVLSSKSILAPRKRSNLQIK
jgi:hypothetical protein